MEAALKILALSDLLKSFPNFAEHPDQAHESAGELDQESVELAESLAILRRYLGNGATVGANIQDHLLPLVSALDESATDEFQRPPDPKALTSLVDQIRPQLTDAVESIIAPDPYTAAQFHAQQAAQMLLKDPVEFGPTLGQTSAALSCLQEAWNQAIHRAALRRAVRLPALAKAIWEERHPQDRLKLPIAGTGMSLPAPQGYEDPIRAYFQAIRQADRHHVPSQ